MENKYNENDSIKSCIHLYQELYKYHLGKMPQLPTYGTTHTMFKNLLKRYSLSQVGLLLFTHFEWRGMTGELDMIWEKACSNGFPIPWLILNAPQYETYLMASEPTCSMWAAEDGEEIDEYIDFLVRELDDGNSKLPF